MKTQILSIVSLFMLVSLTSCPKSGDPDPVPESTNFFKMELDGANYENAPGAGSLLVTNGLLIFGAALKSSNNAVFTFACKDNISGNMYSFNGFSKDSTAFGVNFATGSNSVHANIYEICGDPSGTVNKSTEGTLQFVVSGSGATALAIGSFSGELAVKDGKQTCKNGFETDKYKLVKVSGSFRLPYAKTP